MDAHRDEYPATLHARSKGGISVRKWILPLSLCLGLILPAFSGVAAAAGPSAAGAQAAAHGFGHGHATGRPAQNGQGGAFGQSVEQAVYAAFSSGQKGTALAEAVHVVIGTFKPNAKGISVAEAVYQSVYGAGNGTITISTPFQDMGGAGWAAPSVDALAQAGVIRGTTKTTFSPNAMVTGAELLTMLDRLQNWQASSGTSQSGSTANAQLAATAPAFALQAIRAALSRGIVQGVGGLTSANAPLTRAQAVVLLINSLGLGQTAQSESTSPLSLSGPVPNWARGAIALAIQLGLLQGSDGQILANQTLTRAQMAVLLARVAVLEAIAMNGQSTAQ